MDSKAMNDTEQLVPPEGCICASFWTVRQAHKSDCPLAYPIDGELWKKFDEIFEDLAFGHNFDYAAKELRKLFAAHVAGGELQHAQLVSNNSSIEHSVDGELREEISKLKSFQGHFLTCDIHEKNSDKCSCANNSDQERILQLFDTHLQAAVRETLIDLWIHKLEPTLEESDTKIKVRNVIDTAINETRLQSLKKEASK